MYVDVENWNGFSPGIEKAAGGFEMKFGYVNLGWILCLSDKLSANGEDLPMLPYL